MSKEIRVVHYINQFFGQYGSEEKAHIGPLVKEEKVGPGVALERQLGNRGRVVATVICGDNYIAERLDEAVLEVVELIKKYSPDLVIAGPAYVAGRYGVACGAVCQAVQKNLGIPAITGMFEENPGVELYKKDVYILKTGNNAKTMMQDMNNLVNFGLRLVNGEEIGPPEQEGYFKRGLKKNVKSDKKAAERAVDMLLAKFHGRPFQTEVPISSFNKVEPAPPVEDLTRATIALITDGGLIPKDNPDGIEPANATKYGRYSIAGSERLQPEDFIVHHRGYDTSYAAADPERLVPVSTMRELEQEGAIGKLYDHYLVTTGVMTSLENAKKMGRGMAEQLKKDGVDAVLLTST